MKSKTALVHSGLFHNNNKRGTVWLGAALDNCCVTKTDDAALNIRLACRNDSNVDMDRVQIELCERLTWGTTAVPKIDPITGACYSKSSSSALSQCEINVLSAIPDVQLPGLARRERQGLFIQSASWQSMGGGGDDDRPKKIARLQQQIYSDLTAANDDDDDDDHVHASVRNLVSIHLPEAARESYAGQLWQVSHFVRIGFHTAATSFFFGQKKKKNHPVVMEISIHILGVAAQPETGWYHHRPAVPTGPGDAYQVANPPSTTRQTTTA